MTHKRETSRREPLKMHELRKLLAEGDPGRLWRSLDEIAETEEFRELVEREFPRTAPPWASAMDRRQFLKIAAASMALAGLAGCRRQPIEKIVPYVKTPEGMVPGIPDYYASTVTLGGYGHGVLVKSHTGRPVFLAGNPEHPASLGATDPWVSAAILDLYDPVRSQTVLFEGIIKTYEQFLAAAREELALQRADGGRGLRILTETVTSPTLAGEIGKLLAEFPNAKWYQWEPVNNDNAVRASMAVFGKVIDTIYEFDRADVVVALEGDFIGDGPGRIHYTRKFSDKRRVRKDTKGIVRLYSAESTPSLTGAMADNKLRVSPSRVEAVARGLASALGLSVETPELNEKERSWVSAVAADLREHRGRSIVYPGRVASVAVHVLSHLINAFLSNEYVTVRHIAPVAAKPTVQLEDLKQLHSELSSGLANAVIIIGSNPVYNAPADLPFADLLKSARFSARLGVRADETSLYCRWHVPMAHELETWGDARAFDGTVSFMQPLIEPLLRGKSPLEVLPALLGRDVTAETVLKEHWQRASGLSGEAFTKEWRKWLHDGVMPGSASASESVSPNADAMRNFPVQRLGGIEISFRPDPTIYDGRFSENAWMQELPKPLYQTTWDNVIAMSPAMAEQLGLAPQKEGRHGKGAIVDVVTVAYKGREITGASYVLHGHADDSVTVTFGYGRKLAMLRDAGNTPGYSAFEIQSSDSIYFGSGVVVTKTGERREIALVQSQHSMVDPAGQKRPIVRPTTLEDFIEHPDYVHHVGVHHGDPVSMYPDREYTGNKWGMVVDTSVCTGCSACVTACQNENNIPPIGRDEVTRGRIMHWIRIDRYYGGNSLDDPATYHMPVMCQHCEKAPCEVVCPVHATTHDDEGLNVMTYNRCVGTRYCSNNCPYKVRRFNFFEYSERNVTPIQKLLMNPDVTVRSRGVMEKCSFCVQRINAARKAAKKENRPIRDGEVQTACQAACPAKAIYFGNLNDPNAEVTKLKEEPHNYALLEELNTRPRTTYLGKVTNPNPQLSGKAGAGH